LGGETVSLTVRDPLGRPVTATYGFVENTKTAIIEMAAAAGLPLLKAEERNPLITSTYGVGQMIVHAMEKGARRFLLGIGGSATNDGGLGMLTALGFSFRDKDGTPVGEGAAALRDLHTISKENAHPLLSNCEFLVACDVQNPLCGEKGCSAVFSPQKGARPEDVPQMDAWLAAYAEKTKEIFPTADPDLPGSGAAGGLGFALCAYLNATLVSGVSLVLSATGLDKQIQDADLVITGEGRLDEQSVMGKAPAGVAALAKSFYKPVVAFCGCVGKGATACNNHGIDAYFPILQAPCSLAEAMDKEAAYRNLSATAEQAVRLFATNRF
jgi:glycerate kinase